MTNDQDDDTINLPSLAKVVKTGTTVWEPLRSAEVAVLSKAKELANHVKEYAPALLGTGLHPVRHLIAAVDALVAAESTDGKPTSDIHEALREWHEMPGGPPLHDYLGMTWEQYARWAEKGELPEGSRFAAESTADGPEQTDGPRTWRVGDAEPPVGTRIVFGFDVWVRHPRLHWVTEFSLGTGALGIEWHRLLESAEPVGVTEASSVSAQAEAGSNG